MINLSSYGVHELSQTVRDEPWAVRDEAGRRHNLVANKILAARRRLEKLQARQPN